MDDKDTDRGSQGQRAKDTDRGLGSERVDASGIAGDIFQRASQLGGMLVVAFVAPMGPSIASRNGSSSVQRALLGIGEAAAKDEIVKVQDEKQQTQNGRSQAEKRAIIAGQK